MSLDVRKTTDKWTEIIVQLNSQAASVDHLGVIQLATQLEVNTAEDALKAVTPLTLGKDKPNGVATLDHNGLVTFSRLPLVISTQNPTPSDYPAIWITVN